MSAVRPRRAWLAALAFAAVFCVLAPTSAVAQCTSLDASAMYLDPQYQMADTAASAIQILMPEFGIVKFPPHGAAPVTALHVIPPQMLLAEEAFVVGEDYSGCLNAGGSGEIDFQRAGAYFVQVTFADGFVDHFVVYAVAVPGPPPPTGPRGPKGGFTQTPSVPTQGGAHGFHGTPRDFGSQVEPSGFTEALDVQSLGNAIGTAEAGAGGPIDVTLRYHGSAGNVWFADHNEMGMEADASGNLQPNANLLDFCRRARGKVKSLTLMVCNVGAGPKGLAFMQYLSTCLARPAQPPIPITATNGWIAPTWKGDLEHASNFRWTSSGSVVRVP